jgi:hypothetical protein
VEIYLTYWRVKERVLCTADIWNSSRYLTKSFLRTYKTYLFVTSISSSTRLLPGLSVLKNKVLRKILKPKEKKEDEGEN